MFSSPGAELYHPAFFVLGREVGLLPPCVVITSSFLRATLAMHAPRTELSHIVLLHFVLGRERRLPLSVWSHRHFIIFCCHSAPFSRSRIRAISSAFFFWKRNEAALSFRSRHHLIFFLPQLTQTELSCVVLDFVLGEKQFSTSLLVTASTLFDFPLSLH